MKGEACSEVHSHEVVCLQVIAQFERMLGKFVKATGFVKPQCLFVFLPYTQPNEFEFRLSGQFQGFIEEQLAQTFAMVLVVDINALNLQAFRVVDVALSRRTVDL